MDKVDVRGDGRVILYKRVGLKNLVYQARLRIPNAAGYKIVTTKTGNLREAERIARTEHRSTKLAVIAGVGTRHYYRKLGFELEGPYMVKSLGEPPSRRRRRA